MVTRWPLLAAVALACGSVSPVAVGLDDGVMLSGQVVGQFDGLPVAGVKVTHRNRSTTTDQDGRFELAGTASSRLRPLILSATGIVNRTTYARTGDSRWKVVPAGFNMAAYDDLGRSFTAGTIRWAGPPKVFIDTRRHCFSGGDPGTWAKEAAAQARAFVEAWTAGTTSPQIVITSSPPADLTAGTIIVHMSECDSHYGGGFIGIARVSWDQRGEILAASIYARYKKYATKPGKRQGILGHELGHALGYRHMQEPVPSLMEPSLGSKTDLLPFDHLAARFLYGRVPGNEAPDVDVKYSRSVALAAAGYWEGP